MTTPSKRHLDTPSKCCQFGKIGYLVSLLRVFGALGCVVRSGMIKSTSVDAGGRNEHISGYAISRID